MFNIFKKKKAQKTPKKADSEIIGEIAVMLFARYEKPVMMHFTGYATFSFEQMQIQEIPHLTGEEVLIIASNPVLAEEITKLISEKLKRKDNYHIQTSSAALKNMSEVKNA